MNRIFITGDTHGNIDIHKLTSSIFKVGQSLTKDDYLIICGDFGCIWDGGKLDKYNLSFFNKKPYKVLFCDGNHENFNLLNKYHVKDWNGGKIHKISDNVYHLMRGEIYDICGNSFFVFGGATSIDKNRRIENISWWKEEDADFKEMDYALSNLQKHNNKVDYIITHTVPQTISKNEFSEYNNWQIYDFQSPTEKFLDEIYNLVDFKCWFAGHYHFDHYFTELKLMELYNTVIELKKGFPIVSELPIA